MRKEIKNRREQMVYDDLRRKGYEVYHKGYPDFIAYKEKTNRLIFIEVKRRQKGRTKKMGLSYHQKRVCEILRKFHPVEIRYVI